MTEEPAGRCVEVTVERLEGSKVKLGITVDREEVARAYDRACRNLAGQVNVPGFRRGKVPRAVLERHVKPEAFKEEALDIILPASYSQALDAKDLEPIDRPQVNVVSFAEGEPLVFEATVEVKPEVKLGQYTGLGLSVPPKPVDEADIQGQVEAMRERRAELVPAEPGTKLADGLFAVIDYHGTVDGEPFEGGDSEGVLVQLGAGQLETEVEAAVKGAQAGEERECALTFPEDIRNESLRGKTAQVKVRVKEVKVKKLPELTDDLVKELSGLENVESLRKRIAEGLEERARREAREELARQVVEKVVEAAEVEIPETLVTRRTEQATEDMNERLAAQGLDLDRYLAIVGLDREQWDKDTRARAKHQVKKDLVLEAISRREDIRATDAEVEFEMARLAAATGQKPEKVRKLFRASPARLESLRAGIITSKTVSYLVRENEARIALPDGAVKSESGRDSESGPGPKTKGEGRGEGK
jgi:trigger factor